MPLGVNDLCSVYVVTNYGYNGKENKFHFYLNEKNIWEKPW